MELPSVTLANWSSLWCEVRWAFVGPVPEESREVAFGESGYRAWLLTAGEGTLGLGSQGMPQVEVPVEAGRWLFIPGGGGKQRFSADARIISVSFEARWPTEQPLLEGLRPRSHDAAAHPALERRARGLARACRLAPSRPHRTFSEGSLPLSELCRVNARLYQWLEVFVEAAVEAGWRLNVPTEVDPRYAEALRRVMHHPLAQPFRASELAEETGLSVSHLNRLFTLHARATPVALFEQRRRDHAGQRVLRGDAPLKEIAYELGFAAPSHFTAWFRKRFGQAPAVLRRQERDGRQ